MEKLIKRIITIKAMEQLQAICRPLTTLGINNFSHDMTFGNGRISILTTSSEFFNFYYEKGCPAVFTSDEGRVLDSGIYTSQWLVENENYSRKVCAVLKTQFNYKNVISFVEKENECQHMFSFFFNLNEPDYLYKMINNLEIIKKFISNYKFQAKEIVVEAKKSKNYLILPNSNTNVPNLKLITEMDNVKNETRLSPQRKKCLELLAQGLSFKEIARVMHLSPRTVEHHLSYVRKLLDCKTSKQLISYYLSIG